MIFFCRDVKGMEQKGDKDLDTVPKDGGHSVITTRRQVRTITTTGHITTGHVADDDEDYDDNNQQVDLIGILGHLAVSSCLPLINALLFLTSIREYQERT
jgi:hypothetical protein